jgi:hypothetical protein
MLGYLLATRRFCSAVIPSGVSRTFGFARSAGTRSRGISLRLSTRFVRPVNAPVFFP